MNKIKEIIDFVMDILETVVFLGSLFVVFYLFIMQPHKVVGASMNNSFHDGDIILTSKITYKFSNPQRGDVIVFRSPSNPDIDYIKRIVGLSGDKVMVLDKKVFVNGYMLNEDYIAAKTSILSNGFLKEGVEIIVPEGYLFVMGDNRPYSSDSREFGPIPVTDVIGKVFFRYYPVTSLGSIKNPYNN